MRAHEATARVVTESFIQRATDNIPRAGEGSAIELRDGSVMLIYTRFKGPSDTSPACLVKSLSRDRGRTWSPPVMVQKAQFKGSLNVMSASLLRLGGNKIALLFLEKPDHKICIPFVRFSHDEGNSWSAPKALRGSGGGYHSINNDRLSQTEDGRVLAPFNEYTFSPAGERDRGACGVFYSDDGGETWQKSARVRMKTANALRPERVSPKKNSVWKKLAGDGILNQEPGVVQLSNGALMMWVRTLGGYMYKSVSKDNGLTWPDFTPVPSIVSPLAPQSIKRIPGTPRLLCVYNNHKGYNFAEEPQWSWRTPLSAAVSDDDGETWKTLPDIEDSSHNYCYTSILFLGGETLLSYYVSENSIRPDGAEERRNLASLKIKIINLDFLKGSGI